MPKKKPKRKLARKKATRKKRTIRRQKPARRKKTTRRKKPARGKSAAMVRIAPFEEKGVGSEAAGQSGDVQGLSQFPGADSESVEELAEEGQAFEAGIIRGVENAPDADASEVTTKEVPEDDVPPEYRETED